MKFKNILSSLLIPIVTILAFATSAYATTGTFSYTGSMNIERWGSQATILLSDGRVLVFGNSFSKTAEIYDPITGTFSLTGDLVIPIGNPVGVRLADGRVLIAGGQNMNTFHTTNIAEIYDPTTGTFSLTGSMIYPRNRHTATLLPNGKVLVEGGAADGVGAITTAEIYDPTTGTFSITGTMNYRSWFPTATLLQDGKVLIVGEEDGNKSEIYDPSTGAFSSQDTIDYHYHNTSTLLPNGKVLITGGATPNPPYVVNTAEIYDPTTNTFSLTGNMLHARQLHTAILLPSGKVLIVGGQNNDEGGITPAELYDPGSGSFQLTGSLNESRSFFAYPALNLLGNGKVLIASGIYQNTTVEIYDPDATNNVAPIIGIISPSVNPVQVNNSVTVNASFTDSNISDTHTASWNWGDGLNTIGNVNESNGSGTVSNSHIYTSAGTYTVTLTVTDNNNVFATSILQYLIVYDQSAGFVTGSGNITSPAGAEPAFPTSAGTATFGLNVKYTPNNAGTPTGTTMFTFPNGGFDFISTSYDWLVINGTTAFLHGHGTINSAGNYTFLVSVIDGSPDKFRIKITDSSNAVLYDNQIGVFDATPPVQEIVHGQIKIHQNSLYGR